MEIDIDFYTPYEPSAQERVLFGSISKLEEHVNKHILGNQRRLGTEAEEWRDLFSKYDEWNDFIRENGINPVDAAKNFTTLGNRAFSLLADLYERFAEEQLKDACLIRRTDHCHQVALSRKNKPLGQVINVLSQRKLFFIAADWDVRIDQSVCYTLCTLYRTELLPPNDCRAERRQRQLERESISVNDRWYSRMDLIAEHYPEPPAKEREE